MKILGAPLGLSCSLPYFENAGWLVESWLIERCMFSAIYQLVGIEPL